MLLPLNHDTSPILRRTVRLHLKARSRKERKPPLKNLENSFLFPTFLLSFLLLFLFFFQGCFIYLFSFHFKSDSQLVVSNHQKHQTSPRVARSPSLTPTSEGLKESGAELLGAGSLTENEGQPRLGQVKGQLQPSNS